MKRQLPRPFKFVGYALPVVFFGVMLILRAVDASIIAPLKDKPQYFFATICFGLLIVILSRDKIEDERTNQIRLNCFTLAFLFGLIQVITNNFGFMEQDNLYLSSYVMAMMEGMFLLSFEVQKRFLA